jgi:hypothetical protein
VIIEFSEPIQKYHKDHTSGPHAVLDIPQSLAYFDCDFGEREK